MNAQIFLPCLRGSLLDMTIVLLFTNYWSWSALGWILLTTTLVWSARIILNVFFRKKLTKLTRYFKENYFKENETGTREQKKRKKELF